MLDAYYAQLLINLICWRKPKATPTCNYKFLIPECPTGIAMHNFPRKDGVTDVMAQHSPVH